MKIGLRTPSLKKSIKARTTGKIKRSLKKSINPMYDKKGVGLITDPEKAIYNKVYKKTTFGGLSGIDLNSSKNHSFLDLFKSPKKEKKSEVKRKEIELTNLVNECEHKLFLYNQSMTIVNDTTNPDTFFNNLDTAKYSLERAVEISKYDFINASGDDLEKGLERLTNEKLNIEEEFVKRYYFDNIKKANVLKTEKGKQNNLSKGKERLLEYRDKFEDDTIKLIDILYNS
ncbi:TPA: hypothetical protein VDA20_001717 [Streptococcus pyogenes]|uniref:hypothetical protein n=1 Tax=Streptococcus pyogenes TaxID=1314 RepID=UPI0000D75168|nr:hypothetical protein [Streptococcus pyogenes]APZ81897.1 hypothetical protein STR01_26 [Streptococcus phage Str01]EPZ46861.1 hypothetical protein HMPREF1229_0820 [Streptococcus pyogenes GA40634]ERL18949.1 hypothetical protein HMPREF1227_0294 [Streptococcus pyogenes GA41046]QBX19923.1 hypothetical protein Javan503_0002 [Streptococcus phage Javan503]HER4523051.1 hypothetical protein [Streptococcus pyogenes NGAS760]HER4544901.1 hypothetical protein [Streptococcus pyogenes NGAS675]HER4548460.1